MWGFRFTVRTKVKARMRERVRAGVRSRVRARVRLRPIGEAATAMEKKWVGLCPLVPPDDLVLRMQMEACMRRRVGLWRAGPRRSRRWEDVRMDSSSSWRQWEEPMVSLAVMMLVALGLLVGALAL